MLLTRFNILSNPIFSYLPLRFKTRISSSTIIGGAIIVGVVAVAVGVVAVGAVGVVAVGVVAVVFGEVFGDVINTIIYVY
jgi:hypothetical protein